MPDEPELQRHFGQLGCQRQGCGFPVANVDLEGYVLAGPTTQRKNLERGLTP